MFKKHVQKKLEKYVKRYFAAHPDVKLIVVAGSVGKTSTKAAIATVLLERYRVRMEIENHNSEISTPLAILGIPFPEKLRSLGGWMRIFKLARERIKAPTDVDIIVQELGADKIGDIAAFGKYLVPDLAVVTAVTPEHMENFLNIENIAKEELQAANFSKTALINREDVDGNHFAKYLTNAHIFTYGDTETAEYSFIEEDFDLEQGYKGFFETPERGKIEASVKLVGEHSLRPVIAAVAVGVKMGLAGNEISRGVSKIRAIAGRMSLLKGADGSVIIDDTYNSSPAAVEAAMKALYSLNVPMRVAVLGDMNELGAVSGEEHKALGEMCDPDLLSWVVTVGDQAFRYVGPAAKTRGCQVRSFMSALEAGAFVRSILEPGAAILFKGSQNGVYLEEGVKVVLASTEDGENLVRQSKSWMEKKRAFFEGLTEIRMEADE